MWILNLKDKYLLILRDDATFFNMPIKIIQICMIIKK